MKNPLINYKTVGVILFLCAIIFLVFHRTTSLPSENPKPGKCLVVEEKYCNSFVLVKSPYSNTEKSFAAFKLPKGASIFAPIDGYVSNESNFHFANNQVSFYPGETISFPNNSLQNAVSFYAFTFYELKQNSSKTVTKGQLIGTVSDKNITYFGNYSLIFYVIDRKTGKEDINKLMQVLR